MKIFAFGEPMIELAEKVIEGKKLFIKGFGGDTSNFSVACARQGADVSYITSLGNDAFGQEFLDLYKKENIDTSNILLSDEKHTGVYFIHYSEKGHEFSYMRKDSAASNYKSHFLPEKALKNADCLFVSGITQAISNDCCDAVFKAIEVAKFNKTLVVYDPNLRLKLWSLERAKAIINYTAKQCDIFMPSYEDAQSLTNLQDEKEIIQYYHDFGIKFVILKCGSKGVFVSDGNKVEFINAYKVKAIDQTGAGDTFDGAFVVHYLENKQISDAAKYANAAAALSTLGIGAVAPIPYKKDVEDFISSQ